MTPEKAFKKGLCNPDTGMCARDWFAIGCLFSPQGVVDGDGQVFMGYRVVTAIDAATTYFMHMQTMVRDPEPLTAGELIEFFEALLKKFGRPRKGLVVSHSCWLSSLELAMDDDTAEQGEFLQAIGHSFGPMADREKGDLTKWATDRGLELLFDGDQIS